MSRYGGSPSWVSRQNEAIMKSEVDRINSDLDKAKRENAELQQEIEVLRKKLKECESRLDE